MVEHELPPTRGILSLMSRLSALAPVAGAAATFGTPGAVHIAAAVLIGVLATFVAFAGLLMASDWQADAQSRHDWAEIGLTPAQLSLAVETGPASDMGFRYLATGSDEAVPRVFRANHVAAQIASNAPRSTQPAEQPSSHPEWDQGRAAAAPLQAHAPENALRPVVGAPSRVASVVARDWKRKRRTSEIAPSLRLVANSDTWPDWPAPIPPRADKTADIIVLSDRQCEQAPPLPEASIVSNGAESMAQPTCRGPPRSRARRSTVPPDPVVCDNFGPRLPIARAELDVIETYLERELRELLGRAKQADASEKA